jgi:hypothetical protein
MKRINQLLVVLLIIFLTSQLPTFCSADPFVPKGAISGEPNPPLINVVSPKENQTFEVGDTLWLNFSVTRPLTPWNWTKGQLGQDGKVVPKFDTYYSSVGKLELVKYSLDGKNFDITGTLQYEQYGILYYYFSVGRLSAGWHRIEVHAEGSGLYGQMQDDIYIGSKYKASELPSKSVNSTVEINFLVGDANATPYTTHTQLYSLPYLIPLVAIIFAAILFLALIRYKLRIKHPPSTEKQL